MRSRGKKKSLRSAVSAVEEICRAAVEDHAAFDELLQLAEYVTMNLHSLTFIHWDHAQVLARARVTWPVNLAVHRDWRNRTLDVLRQLELGHETSDRPRRKPWSRKTRGNAVVVGFLNVVATSRLKSSRRRRPLSSGQMAEHKVAWDESGALKGVPSPWCEMLALPDLSAASEPQWFEALRNYVLWTYGRPSLSPKLKGMGVHRARHNQTTTTAPTTLANIDDGVWTALKTAFHRVTGFQPHASTE